MTGYDIRNTNEGFNYLLDLHHIFGGYASMTGGKPAWQLSDRLGRSKLGKFASTGTSPGLSCKVPATKPPIKTGKIIARGKFDEKRIKGHCADQNGMPC